MEQEMKVCTGKVREIVSFSLLLCVCVCVSLRNKEEQWFVLKIPDFGLGTLDSISTFIVSYESMDKTLILPVPHCLLCTAELIIFLLSVLLMLLALCS